MTYNIQYDMRSGLPSGILRSDGARIPIDPNNADFQAFVAWNAQQTSPLNYTTGKTMIFAQLDQTTGLLSNIRQGVFQFENDVPLAAMPAGAPGTQYVYDSVNQLAVPALSWTKQNACAAIEAKTQQLLAGGFSYTPSGGTAHQFGLDLTSVSNWHGLMLASSMLSYPFQIAAVDGTLINLASAAEVQAFYGAGVQRSAAIQQGGIQLKAQVMACTTADQVNAIVDSRT